MAGGLKLRKWLVDLWCDIHCSSLCMAWRCSVAALFFSLWLGWGRAFAYLLVLTFRLFGVERLGTATRNQRDRERICPTVISMKECWDSQASVCLLHLPPFWTVLLWLVCDSLRPNNNSLLVVFSLHGCLWSCFILINFIITISDSWVRRLRLKFQSGQSFWVCLLWCSICINI